MYAYKAAFCRRNIFSREELVVFSEVAADPAPAKGWQVRSISIIASAVPMTSMIVLMLSMIVLAV